MQHTFTLAAWNFRLARRSLLALWGVFAAQQAVVILWRAAQPGAAGLGMASHYYATMQIFAYLGFYLLTALAAGAATHNSRRARSGYTWATLPGTPGQKLAAKAVTIAAAELVFAAWQLVWYIVEFYPVTALEGWHRRQMYGAVLPADGRAGDREVLYATTEVGTLEPFYCPEDARLVACGLPMADGLTLCVYINKEEKACADLVNAAGVRVDHVELAELAGQSDFSAVARPRSTDRDAVLHIYGDDYTGYLTALRVENGSFALHQCLPVGESVYLRNAEAAVLNTAGDALLIATPEYTTVGEGGADNAYNIYQTGTLLLVCPLDGSSTRYRGRLNTGAERDWGAQLGEDWRRVSLRRYMSYELYEKDRGRQL